MKKFFLFLILLLMPSLVLAVPVTYKGTIDSVDDIGTINAFRVVSAIGTTEKHINQSEQQVHFVLNHMENPGETVEFYFVTATNTINIRSDTQPLPGTIKDMGNIIIPETPIIHSKNPVDDSVTITELQNQIFSIVANDSKGAVLDYFWYKNNILISTGETYTFIGDNTNTGSNAGTYEIKVRVYNKISYSDYKSWDLTVERVKDSDGDSIPDSYYGAVCNGTNVNCNDNCVYVSNNNQADNNLVNDGVGIGDACEGDIDGADVNDADDTIIGDIYHVTTNI